MVDKGVMDVKENTLWDTLQIDTVRLIRYMGKGTECLQKMREEIAAENEGILMPTQVWWLANPRIISERRQNGESAMSLVVFVLTGSQVVQSLVKKGITAVEVWYRDETYMTVGPDSRYELCWWWGHIENRCGS
jgi:hypothetical protein